MFHWGVQSIQSSLINSINNVESKLLAHLFSQGVQRLVNGQLQPEMVNSLIAVNAEC